MADADADPHVAVADMLVERAKPVMPGMAAAGLDAQPAGGKVKLVVEDDHVRGRQLEEAHRFPDRLAREVHEGLRLQQDHLIAAEVPLADLALKARAPRRKAVIRGNAVNGHEADIVAVRLVLPAGVAQPDDQPHRRPVCIFQCSRGRFYFSFSSSFSVLPFLMTSGSAGAVGAAASAAAGAGSSAFGATTWTIIRSGSLTGFHLAPSV